MRLYSLLALFYYHRVLNVGEGVFANGFLLGSRKHPTQFHRCTLAAGEAKGACEAHASG